ncbi:hypothetical protein RND71_025064 [Anisodus tanguticus]|uniref:Uncharacterized protein n=1 Tax=Anisodus tanguticus TaxID=243964 RepID=A0AAE1V4H7_9SOLA|nr:hypothetical protein RND71_025064 [Anisodus tanguticus]
MNSQNAGNLGSNSCQEKEKKSNFRHSIEKVEKLKKNVVKFDKTGKCKKPTETKHHNKSGQHGSIPTPTTPPTNHPCYVKPPQIKKHRLSKRTKELDLSEPNDRGLKSQIQILDKSDPNITMGYWTLDENSPIIQPSTQLMRQCQNSYSIATYSEMLLPVDQGARLVMIGLTLSPYHSIKINQVHWLACSGGLSLSSITFEVRALGKIYVIFTHANRVICMCREIREFHRQVLPELESMFWKGKMAMLRKESCK